MTTVIRHSMRGLRWLLVPFALLALLVAGCNQPQTSADKPASTSNAAQGTGGQDANTASDTGGQAGNVAPNTENKACDIFAGTFNLQGVEPADTNGSGNAVCAVHVSFGNLGPTHDQKATLISIVGLYAGDGPKSAYGQMKSNPSTVTYHSQGATVYDLTGVGVHGFCFAPPGSEFTVIDIDLSAPDGLLSDATTLKTMVAAAYQTLAHQA